MRVNRFITSAFVLIIFVFFALSSSSSEWKKKQFDSYEELASAFKYAKYDDVKKEFGEPSYKFISFGEETTITYSWHGVGVKGKRDAYMQFSAIEGVPGFYSGYEFETVYATSADFPPSNSHKFNIE